MSSQHPPRRETPFSIHDLSFCLDRKDLSPCCRTRAFGSIKGADYMPHRIWAEFMKIRALFDSCLEEYLFF